MKFIADIRAAYRIDYTKIKFMSYLIYSCHFDLAFAYVVFSYYLFCNHIKNSSNFAIKVDISDMTWEESLICTASFCIKVGFCAIRFRHSTGTNLFE